MKIIIEYCDEYLAYLCCTDDGKNTKMFENLDSVFKYIEEKFNYLKKRK